MKIITILAAAMLILAGCGPVYTTDYKMVPPDTEEGRYCANNCLMAQRNCTQSCGHEVRQCQENERLRGENKYMRYVREREKAGKEIKRSEDSFINDYHCDDDDCAESCAEDYRICHTNCGGQVIPHTYCSAFCE